ncbi:fimbrial protein [Klebsiella grimontii]|uniref:fimbrial protein n=1 Tax=Klebsiella grimontii TaxID=2058152 RepID=UPI001CCD7A6D|nr:fimbrial protein [Klebsiella grimontii]
MKLIKYGLFVFFAAFLWGKTDKVMATCSLTSALSNVTVNQNYTFSTNSNGAASREQPQNTAFWSGNSSETYVCPSESTWLGFCAADSNYLVNGTGTVLGPGINAKVYVSNGSGTASEDGGCYSVATSGHFPAKETIPPPLAQWKYVGIRVIINDSSQARNITINNILAGYVYLATENYNNKTIGGTPLTKVYLSGTITIPASCQLSSSSVVELPDTWSGDYSKAGTGVKVGTGTTQPMSIKCLGGSETATIDLHVTTNKVSGDDIVTSNSDVGVRVLDGSGNTISANNGKVSATLNNGTVDVPFTYVPVAITGKNPTPGDYSAIETITVTIP